MSQSEYISSAKVIFSDRGSIYFGLLVIAFMVILGLGLFILKFQKKTPHAQTSNKSYHKQLSSTLILKHRFLFKPSQANYLLFSAKSGKHSFSSKK